MSAPWPAGTGGCCGCGGWRRAGPSSPPSRGPGRTRCSGQTRSFVSLTLLCLYTKWMELKSIQWAWVISQSLGIRLLGTVKSHEDPILARATFDRGLPVVTSPEDRGDGLVTGRSTQPGQPSAGGRGQPPAAWQHTTQSHC